MAGFHIRTATSLPEEGKSEQADRVNQDRPCQPFSMVLLCEIALIYIKLNYYGSFFM